MYAFFAKDGIVIKEPHVFNGIKSEGVEVVEHENLITLNEIASWYKKPTNPISEIMPIELKELVRLASRKTNTELEAIQSAKTWDECRKILKETYGLKDEDVCCTGKIINFVNSL